MALAVVLSLRSLSATTLLMLQLLPQSQSRDNYDSGVCLLSLQTRIHNTVAHVVIHNDLHC